MTYADRAWKFVAVLNKNIDIPQQMNALGHMAVGLIAHAGCVAGMQFLRYEDHDGTIHPAISRFPFIILAAKNSQQIRALRTAAREAGILYNDFVHTMVGTSAVDQLQMTRSTREQDLEYWGICLFGSAALVDPLTKRFSLLTAPKGVKNHPGANAHEEEPPTEH